MAKIATTIKKFKWSLKESLFPWATTLRNIFLLFLVCAFIFPVSFVLYKYWIDVNSYVVSLDSNTLTTFFTAVGTVIAAVLVLAFSLSLFPIQQAAERYSPTILDSFVKDKLTLLIFIIIALFSLSVFSFSLLPKTHSLTAILIILSVVFLAITFALIKIQHSHIARIINPKQQLNRLLKDSLRYLRNIEYYVEEMIEIGAIKLSAGDEKLYTDEAQKNLLKAGIYTRKPELLSPLDGSLCQIFDIVRKFSYRREYEVTRLGLQYIAQIISEYLLLRKETTIPVPKDILVFGTDLDTFLVKNYERLSSIERVAIENSDAELGSAVIDALGHIIYVSTEVKMIQGVLPMENPVADLALGYLHANVQEALSTDLYDVGIAGTSALQSVGEVLINKNMNTSVSIVLSYLKDIAQFGVLKKQCSLTNYALAGLGTICHEGLTSKYYDKHMLMLNTLDHAKEVSTFAVPLIEDSSLQGTLSVQYYLGAFFDLSKPTAIAYVVPKMSRYINDAETEEDRNNMKHVFFNVNKELWRFYRALGEAVATQESFLLWLIHTNIEMIGKTVFELMNDSKWQKEEKELEEILSWYFSFYWVTICKHDTITKYYIWNFADTLAYFGLLGVKENRIEVSSQCVSSILSIAKDYVAKEKSGHGYDPPRIVQRAIYIGILAKKLNKPSIHEKVINGIQGFHKVFVDSLMESPQDIAEGLKNRLLVEIAELKDDYRDLNVRHRDEAKKLLFEEVTEEDIAEFEKEIVKIINSQGTTE